MSLVEVLVAMAIGLIGIVIIMQAYITSDKFNRSTAGEGSAQTNGTVALFTLERDLRNAGYGISSSGALGCGNIYWYYSGAYSSNAGGTLGNIKLAPVYIDSSVQPNVITVMYATGDRTMLPLGIGSFVPASAVLTLDPTQNNAAITKGDLVLLVNAAGSSCTLAEVTGLPGADKLQMNSGASGPYNPPAWGSFPATYGPSDSVVDIGNPKVRSYSIVNNNLRVTDTLLQATGATPLDLVDGIVDLRAQYGKDDGVNNGSVSNTTYVAGDGIIDEYDNGQPATAAAWKQVIAVRIGVLARIGDYEKPVNGVCAATTAAPKWANQTQSFTVPEPLPSCYRYRVFESIVPLRNVIWAP